MKVLITAFTILVSTSAFAEKVVLQCTTGAGGLDLVQLVEEGTAGLLKISFKEGDSEMHSFQLASSLDKIKAGKGDTLVAAKDLENTFGGAIQDAALLQVSGGQKKALLAVNGNVYYLNCTKR